MIFLGCDGGSTKTEWLLADETGHVLAHCLFPGCNFAFLGKDGFAALMKESCETLLANGGITAEEVTGAMFGMTVYGEIPGTEDSIPGILSRLLPKSRISVENDSVASWSGSLGGQPGIQIVSGTGSVAYGRDETHHGLRVGGWSLFFADEGSCSWIARQMICEYVKQADGRHPRTGNYEELRRELGLEHDLYLSGYLQKDIRENSALLAQLQQVVMRAAQNGDLIAQDIYRRAAEELTEMAITIDRRLHFQTRPITVSYSGGLFKAGDVIMKPFRACMESAGFSLQKPLYSPVIGAVALVAENYLIPEQCKMMLKNISQQI